MIVLDYPQRSTEWRQARCGRLTASRAHDILSRGRHGLESIARRNYRRQLICEQLTGIPEDRAFVSRAMERGRLKEPAARQAYAARTGLEVLTSGFVQHPALMAGCSLDGHVGAFNGILEIKAPNTATHLLYLATRRVPLRYRSQITHHLWLTDAPWCDFVSFDDRLPARMQLLVIRLHRDELDVAGYAREAARFLADVSAQVGALSTLSPLEFFRTAPLDVAASLLATSRAIVEARKREPAPLTPASWPAPVHRQPLVVRDWRPVFEPDGARPRW